MLKVIGELELSIDDWKVVQALQALAPEQSQCKIWSDIMREGLGLYRETFRRHMAKMEKQDEKAD